MSTKPQLENSLKAAEVSAQNYYALWQLEESRADKLQRALDTQFSEYETPSAKAYPAERMNVWSRNEKIADGVRAAFKSILEWAGRNRGYGDTEEEKQATGLGGLVYLTIVNPDMAIRFAAEVCEQNNYHGEAAKLMNLYDQVTQPYANHRQEATTVNFWAE